jgi:hypothetical protein
MRELVKKYNLKEVSKFVIILDEYTTLEFHTSFPNRGGRLPVSDNEVVDLELVSRRGDTVIKLAGIDTIKNLLPTIDKIIAKFPVR